MKSKIFLIVLITTNHLLYAQTNGIWTQKANLIGVKRMGAVGFSIGNYGYVGTGIEIKKSLIFSHGKILQAGIFFTRF